MNGDGTRRILAGGVIGLVVAVVLGVVVGHFVWNATSVSPSRASASRFGGDPYFAPQHSRGGEGESEGEGANGGAPEGLFGEGRGEGGGESGGSSESGGEGGGGVSGAVTSKVDPGLVDIDTELGYVGGAAAGTGMVVSSSGEVVTNNHVITGATTIRATDIGNGKTYSARVVGYDYGGDIAVLQLEGASGLHTVSLGNSASVHVGDRIATIGNAGGVGGTPSATAGEVGAVNQAITAGDEIDGGQERLTGLIELNGDLQPGDSGGPLVNGSGEVLGMDTAASATFRFQSSADQGFAIPIKHVEAIASQIVAGESSNKLHIGATAFLGVLVEGQGTNGALVENVLSGTPAAESGLAGGDLITAVDGIAVDAPTALTEAILRLHPGESVPVTWTTSEGSHQSAKIALASGPPQ